MGLSFQFIIEFFFFFFFLQFKYWVCPKNVILNFLRTYHVYLSKTHTYFYWLIFESYKLRQTVLRIQKNVPYTVCTSICTNYNLQKIQIYIIYYRYQLITLYIIIYTYIPTLINSRGYKKSSNKITSQFGTNENVCFLNDDDLNANEYNNIRLSEPMDNKQRARCNKL